MGGPSTVKTDREKSKTSPRSSKERKEVKVEKRKITKIFIHCAATKNGKAYDAAAIDKMHKGRFKRKSKYKDTFNVSLKYIGYHYVIYIDGTVHAGRHPEEIGAHVKSHNASSIGVCLIGTDAFTAAQWKSLKIQIAALKALHPKATIHGHREYANKICPGFDVKTWLKNKQEPENKHVFSPKPKADSKAKEPPAKK